MGQDMYLHEFLESSVNVIITIIREMVAWRFVKRVGNCAVVGALFIMMAGCGVVFPKHEQVMKEPAMEVGEQSYRLGPNDSIKIDVFDEPDLSTKTTVSGHGTIKFPLLGEFRVAGMSAKDVEEVLAEQLEAGYLKNPKVTVSIVQYRNFYVSGQARNPGAFPYREGITVLKAITLAGGWTDRAVKDEAEILRVVKGKQELLPVGMEEIVMPDDIIIVPESFF